MATITANNGAYTIIGASSITARVLDGASESYALTGTDATVIRGYVIAADSDVYTLVGTDIGTLRIAAEPGGYLIGGQAVEFLLASRRFAVDIGSYAVTGTSAGLDLAKPYDRGGYTLAGTDATLSRSGFPVIGLDSGSYAISGKAVGLESTLEMGTGEYSLTGTAANVARGKGLVLAGRAFVISNPSAVMLKWRHVVPHLSGTYSIPANNNTTLRYQPLTSKIIIGESTSYTSTGTAATLRTTRTVSAVSGSYAVTGQSAEPRTQYVSGLYNTSGSAVTLLHTGKLVAVPGVYSILGTPATASIITHSFNVDPGVYNVFGHIADLRNVNRVVLAGDQGTYLVNGTAAFLRATRLPLDGGSYTVAGFTADLSTSQVSRWKKMIAIAPRSTQQLNTDTTWTTQEEEPGVVTTGIHSSTGSKYGSSKYGTGRYS